MTILDTIKGKTILSFEVLNIICRRIPSVCISELFPDNSRLPGPEWCLLPVVRKSLIEHCRSGVYCPLNVTHSSRHIKLRLPPTYGAVHSNTEWKTPQTVEFCYSFPVATVPWASPTEGEGNMRNTDFSSWPLSCPSHPDPNIRGWISARYSI